MKKFKILTFVAYYLPGYKSGGPVRTIANMIEQCGDELDFWIVTTDRDFFEENPYPHVRVNAWNRVGKAQVYYAAPGRLSLGSIYRLIRATPHDILYLNSLFNPRFTIKPLLLRMLGMLPPRPVVLAPRGEFSAGALEIKSWKKKSYIHLARLFGMYRNLDWQASSEYEVADIRRIMGDTARRIYVAQDLPAHLSASGAEVFRALKKGSGPLRVVFLSRISPMKNLDFALQVLKQVSVAVEFNIYGLVDDKAHWSRCQALMSELPAHVMVHNHGVVDHEIVAQVLASHDLFFLPTRGENYGHAILEALAIGVPVLISDQTPWQDLEKVGVGWVRSLDNMEAFKQVIEQLANASADERLAQHARARKYAQKVTRDTAIRKQNFDLFINAMNRIKRR